MASEIRVLATLGVMGAMGELVSRYEAATGIAVKTDFAPTIGMLARIRSGETADLAILTAQGIDELTAEGRLQPGSRVDIAESVVGIAVKAGASHPDIGSREALIATLLAARSIAYSKIGASGVFFAGLIERLGIADAVNAKATIVPSGFTAEFAARGEVEIAVQQISELMAVSGIEIVGPLPMTVQTPTIFAAGTFKDAQQGAAGSAFAQYLASSEAAPVLTRTGLRALV